ncbi:unnamed protein product [Chondrus crispus]|uniref:Uncharacterized protein n=1 Tax=Chondrus crispus TaxID=2769 RepID=R7QK79_CHOCR|nr:unnamed protein product [Chondrus crispus]CDF38163.1 unnamed protein product [Chondrus crispus]|eukprot:XP_005718032.1 unnamed protein product [Chondrus crispus]
MRIRRFEIRKGGDGREVLILAEWSWQRGGVTGVGLRSPSASG